MFRGFVGWDMHQLLYMIYTDEQIPVVEIVE